MEARLDVFEAWVENPSLVTDLGLIDQHKKRTINYWRTAPYSERDEAFLRRCMHQAQYDIVLMMDSLYQRVGEVLSMSLKRVLAALMACLEGLLDFIARHRPLYFNMEQKMPDCIRLRKGLELAVGKEDAEGLLPECCTYAQMQQAERYGIESMHRFEDGLPEEMTAAEEVMMKKYRAIWGDFKIHIKVSVALFGALLGTLMNVKVFEPDAGERERIIKFFAEHIRTDRVENVSPGSLSNHSYSTDPELLRAMIALCERMLGCLREAVDRVLRK